MLYIDSGWSGLHGIGRFAREVVSRLDLQHQMLPARGNPSSPLNIVNPRRITLRSGDSVWSPGYNVGLTRAAQVPTVHDLIHLQDSRQSTALKRCYYEDVLRRAITRSRLVLTVSETSRLRIEQWLSDSTIDVVNVGNGTSQAFLDAGERTANIGSFVMVGTSKPHKNVLVALRALALRPEYSVRLVTSDVDAMGALVTSVGVTRQVTILSGLTDQQLADEYRHATALLFPSTLEGFGLPALEAMQCGCPVIFWAGCASVREITAGRGLEVESPQDEREWAEAMDSAAARPDLSDGSFQPWRALYDWDQVAQRVNVALSKHVDRWESTHS